MVTRITRVKKFIHKLLDPNLFIPNVLIPSIVLTLYFAALTYFLGGGVNNDFSGRMWKYLLLLTGGFYLVFFAFLRFTKVSKLKLENPIKKINFQDLFLLLLPLTPVVQYILNNQDILAIQESLYVFGFFAVSSAVFVVVIPVVLGIIGSVRILMILGLSFVFTVINMASLSRHFAWFNHGNLGIQLAVLGGVFLLSFVLYRLKRQKLLYLLIAAFFVSNTAVQLLTPRSETVGLDSPATTGSSVGNSKIPWEDNRIVTLVGDKKPTSTPNIYLLVYDAYAFNGVLRSFGIDNNAQEKYLKDQGFKLYPSTYSLGASSLGTMSRVLNASTEMYGNRRRGVSGDGVVQGLLKSFGYKTYGLFRTDYFFRSTTPTYDFSFPTSESFLASDRLLIQAILMGEFQADLETASKSPVRFLATKRDVFKSAPKEPRFVYMHTDLPGHSQLSGTCLANEVQRYNERLGYANNEMRVDLEELVKSDPNSIIVVASDHGPYLTKSCGPTERGGYDISEIDRLDLQSRFGTFLAIRWPGRDFEKYDDITVLQDLFPSIFADIFSDRGMLKAKVDPVTIENQFTSGASVKNGIIYGGINNGEPLFTTDK
jgi:hypothetical protein